MKKFEPRAGASRLSHPGSGAGKLQGDASRSRMLALAITLLAAATFGILYIAVAQGQNSDGALTGLTLSSDSPGTLAVSWNPSSPDPTDYRVNWAKSSEKYPSWTSDDGNLYPTATSVDLTGLEPDVEYKVRLRPRYLGGEDENSPWAGPWTEITARVEQPLPQAPNIMGTAVSPEGEVILMLQDPSDDSITGYQVLRGTDPNNLAVIEEDTASATTRYTDPSPPAGQTHIYAVRARNAMGSSPRSNTVTATVPGEEEEEEEPLIAAQQNSESGVLFSNFHKDYNDVIITQRVPTSIYRFAHSFRAANYWDGSTAEFDFTGITILMTPAIEGHVNALLVTVHADSGDEPGELLHTLGTPTTQSGGAYVPVTYKTPAGSTLSSGVTYWVKLEATADSEFFMEYQVSIRKATDGEEQGQASVNEWEIDNEAIQSKRQTPSTWDPSEQGLAMELLGEQPFQVLVSTMNQPSLSDHGMSSTQMEAQSFTTRPGKWDWPTASWVSGWPPAPPPART